MPSKLERHADELSALGHPVRLAILRFVVQSGDGGCPAGEIQSQVELPASTLSHHLKRLTEAGLLRARGEGTFHYYSADYVALRTLTDYVWQDCCRRGEGGLLLTLESARRAVAEGVGTAFLLATVVGSGIMGERLAGGNVALALLANTLATGAGLVALILTFGPVSGADFNPVVTLADAAEGGLPWREVPAYLTAQVFGALLGVASAHAMFGEAAFAASQHVRSGASQLFSEFVATFGLLSVIWGVSRRNGRFTPFAVGAYITAAYWFTASTSFANPAVTLARSLTPTFSGIRPVDVPGFVAAQCAGALAATALFRFLSPAKVGKVSSLERGARMKTVLFACIHNAGRSQMAAAWFNALGDAAKASAVSAGTEPGQRVHPEVLDAMREVGIDLAGVAPRKLTDELARQSSVLVTMGCGEACPHVPGLRHLDWPLEDPKGKPVERVREIRDEIKALVLQLLDAESFR